MAFRPAQSKWGPKNSKIHRDWEAFMTEKKLKNQGGLSLTKMFFE